MFQRFNSLGEKLGGEQPLDSVGSTKVDAFSDGSFVVAWPKTGVVYRVFDETGTPKTGILSACTGGDVYTISAAVAVLGDDKFVVASDVPEIKYQLFDELGTKIGEEQSVGSGNHPAVASVGENQFAIVWHSNKKILVRRYAQDGPLGDASPANKLNVITSMGKNLPRASIDSFSDGSFIVVWPGNGQGGLVGYGQRFDKNGNKLYH